MNPLCLEQETLRETVNYVDPKFAGQCIKVVVRSENLR